MEDKKSNARIAWGEFIGKFNLGNNDNELEPLLQPTTRETPNIEPVLDMTTTTGETGGIMDIGNTGETKKEPVNIAPVRGNAPRTTVIGENVEITGNCKLDGDIEIYGTISGDVWASGKISVFGNIKGNLNGSGVSLSHAIVQGSIVTDGTVELDSQSTLNEGHISARNIISNGQTDCDMEITETARFHSSALVTGNIHTSRISIEEGAIIKGTIISE